MNLKNNILLAFLCLLPFVLFSCTDEDNTELNKGETPLAIIVNNSVVELNVHAAKAEAIKFDWTSGTNGGTGAGIEYTFELDLKGNNFESSTKESLGRDKRTKTYSHEQLNKILVEEFNVEPNANVELEARVIAEVMDDRVDSQVSEPVSFTVVPYTPTTQTLYLIGSAAPNGWNADDAAAMKQVPNAAGGFTWKGKLNAGELKFITTLGEFTPSYNKGENENTLYYRESGDDPYDEKFAITAAGNYEITLNVLTSKIFIKATQGPDYDQLWFVGSHSGWSFKSMTVDPLDPYVFHYNSELSGEFKLATKNDFDPSIPFYRPAVNGTGAGKNLDVVIWSENENGNDHKWEVTSGTYKIKLDTRDMKIDIVPYQSYPVIYLVGDATPNGWNIGDATPMVASADVNVLTWTGQLNAGEIKFSCDKQSDWNGDWFTASVADMSPSGEAQQMIYTQKGSGLDYKWKVTQAGTYKIVLDQLKETVTFSKQ